MYRIYPVTFIIFNGIGNVTKLYFFYAVLAHPCKLHPLICSPNTAVRPNRIQNEKHYDLAGTFRKTYGKHL